MNPDGNSGSRLRHRGFACLHKAINPAAKNVSLIFIKSKVLITNRRRDLISLLDQLHQHSRKSSHWKSPVMRGKKGWGVFCRASGKRLPTAFRPTPFRPTFRPTVYSPANMKTL